MDYDGTISLVDIGDELMVRHYGNVEQLAAIDAAYDAGQLGSRELIVWDMEVLPHAPELLRADATTMPQDDEFASFVADVRARGAQVEVVSDGLGFYVRPNLDALGLADVPVATNENPLTGGSGMRFPYGHPSCFVCGTCKRERVRLHQAAGRVVVFIGDGTSDRFAAAHADLVFAKESLARICEGHGWPYIGWERFAEVREAVDAAFADGRLPLAAEDLPAWRAQHAPAPRAFICGPEVWGPRRTSPAGGPGPEY
ncbi:MAG TPA: haloacid dehalogenase-like hydrolase [Candidatus Limnocylindria bacterium]|nr:haloacid dehalogenase-like hydrolase [Candidatus Limnocylindria bacterium]